MCGDRAFDRLMHHAQQQPRCRTPQKSFFNALKASVKIASIGCGKKHVQLCTDLVEHTVQKNMFF